MPDNFTNPAPQIGQGPYNWVPAPPKSIGGINPLLGFDSLEIDRGAFRNCYYNNATENNINFVDSGNSSIGEPYYPIRNTTRPLELIDIELDLRGFGSVYCVNTDKNSNFITYTNIRYPSRPMSTIECNYDLSFDIGGQIADNIKSVYDFTQSGGPSALEAFKIMQSTQDPSEFSSNEQVFLSYINSLSNANLLNFNGVLFGSNSSSAPILINSIPVGLNITRVRSPLLGDTPFSHSSDYPGVNAAFQTSTVYLIEKSARSNNTHNDRGQYKAYQSISLVLNDKVSEYLGNLEMVLCLKSIKFFSADRVNFRFSNETQLPAQALGYSMSINAAFTPSAIYVPLLVSAGGSVAASGGADFSGVFYTPAPYYKDSCNIHVKVFSPDYTQNSPGFAHSLSLYLEILSFPFFGPLENFLSGGATFIGEPYWAVLLGPVPFFTQLVFSGTSKVVTANGQIAVISQGTNKNTTGSVSVLLNGNPLNQNIPVLNFSQLYNSGVDFVDNIFGSLLEVPSPTGLSTSLYTNLYTDVYGTTTSSNAYPGSPARNTSYFEAYDIIPPGNYIKQSFIYQSYTSSSEPSIQKLFITDPAVIFKLNNTKSGYITNGLTLTPGFLSAIINANVIDASGYFDTKLIYRLYLVKKSASSFSPNDSEAIKNHIKIDINGSKIYSLKKDINGPKIYTLKIAAYDDSWTFENVLSTSNLTNTPRDISAEIIIDVNSDNSSVSFSGGLNIPDYDFYCAIYSISTPNEKKTLILSDNLSSLTYPLVSYNLQTNFTIVLPLFYELSYQNGGNLQAQRDPFFAGNYVADSNQYSVTLYTFSGATFDTTKSYDVNLNGFNSLSHLLVGDNSGAGITTSFFTNISAGTENSPSQKIIDFLIYIPYNLSDSKISKNDLYSSWGFLIKFDSVLSTFQNTSFRLELNAIDNQTNIIENIFTSYSYTGKESIDISQSWQGIPFFVNKNAAYLSLRIIIENYGSSATVGFSQISMTQNLLNHFSYDSSHRPPGSANLGFYEDLPLQPSAFVDSMSQFYFVIDYSSLPNSGTFLIDSGADFYFTGGIYSPTWVLDSTFPKNMEVQTKGNINQALNSGTLRGLSPYEIFFRTGTGNQISSIDTKKHGQTQLILTTTNQQSTLSANQVLQLVSEGYGRNLITSFTLSQVLYNGDIAELDIQNPILATSDKILLQGQYGTNTVMLELDNPASFAKQPSPPGTLSGIDNSSSIRPKLINCIFTDIDSKDGYTFSVGVTGSGSLLYAFDSKWGPTNNTQILCIEGDPKSTDILSNNYIIGIGSNSRGIVKKTFPTLCATQSGDVLVFYVYTSSTSSLITPNTAIYMKYVNGQTASPPILVLDFHDYLSKYGDYSASGFPSIDNLSVCKDDVYSEGVVYYLAFDCMQKIFASKVTYRQHNVRIQDIVWIYGADKSVAGGLEENFINALKNAWSKGFLIKLSVSSASPISSIYSLDLTNSQRVGFVDFDGFFMGIQFLSGLDILEVLFEKSYELPVVLRKIGTKLG